MSAEPSLPFELSALSVRQLLAAHISVLDELTRRGYIRTRNSPLGDLAETLAVRAYGGTLAPNSEKSFDLTTADGRRLQVKARLVDPGDRRSQAFSAFRSFDFDAALFVLFDSRSYDLLWARELTPEDVRALGHHTEHVRALAITTRAVASAGVEVTATLRSTYAQIDDPGESGRTR